MLTKLKLKKYLIELFPNEFDRKKSLEAWLIRLVCQDSGYEPSSKLKDITNHGCVSGCVNPLIYHSDCAQFYLEFETQICELIEAFMDSTGQTLGQFLDSFRVTIDSQNMFKTYLAWFAVEETAYHILSHFEED